MRKNEHPIPFKVLEELYWKHLKADDNPSGYIAYCRAEAEIVEMVGQRKLKSYNSFRTMLWRTRRRKKSIAYGTCKFPRN